MEEFRNKVLAENIRAELEFMRHSSVVSPGHLMIRINRVPHHVRSVHPQAYTPMVVSIGPFHHSDEKLQNMEKQKAVYVTSFLGWVKVELEMFVVAIRNNEGIISGYYGETSFDSMGGDCFVKMILVDAIFILELFCRCSDDDRWGGDQSDPLQVNQWMLDFVRLDLVLLENQLPFDVLELLFNVAFVNDSNSPDLIVLTFKFFDRFNDHNMDHGNVRINHFTDLIRAFKLVHVERGWRGRMKVKLWYSATALHDAGVKFETGVDLHYENGVLTMPVIKLDDQMEAVVRNVMAFEQFCYWDDEYLTDNFIFLDFLVNTIEDINLLCDREILINKLVDSKAALSVVKNLVTNIADSGVSYHISDICQELSEFYNKPYNRWKARLSVTTLKNQYFNNPWRGAGTVAACLLLLLSLIQTIMSILQVAMA